MTVGITSMGDANIQIWRNFFARASGPMRPNISPGFAGNLLTASDYLGAARLTCVQALWSHEEATIAEAVDQVEPIKTGWPRVYFGDA